MNMKMSQLEQQIGTILDILKSQGHLNSQAGGSDGDSTHSADSNLTGELPDSNIKESPVHVRCPREKQQNLEKNPSRYNDLNLNTKPEKEKNDDALPHWLAPPRFRYVTSLAPVHSRLGRGSCIGQKKTMPLTLRACSMRTNRRHPTQESFKHLIS